ncbi:endonuclease/exonuclease/phosphatase family protein, partial [Escherichia coli]
RWPRPIREDALRVRLVTANVLCTNPDVARLADDLVAEDADIVMVQEVTPEVLAVLRTSRLWSAYRHHRVAERPGYHG